MTFAPTPEPEDWRLSAACLDADPDWFFSDRTDVKDAARAICRRCPSQAPCLAAGLAGREEGIWGGTDENERNGTLRRRRYGRRRVCNDCGWSFTALGGKYTRCDNCAARRAS